MERNGGFTKKRQSIAENHDKRRSSPVVSVSVPVSTRFHRQYVIGNYIADFYCHQAKLVVELDGSQHYDPGEKEYDQKRTDYLQSQGLTVMRFSNLDVMCRFRSVCEAIDMEVKRKITPDKV